LQGVAPPGNDNTAANSRVAVLSAAAALPKTATTGTSVVAAVLSEVAALPQDRQHHHLCRGGGLDPVVA